MRIPDKLSDIELRQLIVSHLIKNPIERGKPGCYKEVADKFDVTSEHIRRIYRTLRKNGQVETNKKKLSDEPLPANNSLEFLVDDIKKLIRKKEVRTLEELSDHYNIGVGKIKEAVNALIALGHNLKMEDGYITFSNIIQKSESTILDVHKMSTGFYKFGAIGDNHMCSKYERNDVLNAIYDVYEQEGVKVVYNTGNWIDGEARFNTHDLNTHGMDNQIDYFIKNYPRKEGIITYFIAGDDHEGWYTQREGIDVGKYAEFKAREAGRTDLVYLGYMEADVVLKAPNGKTTIRVLHPGGGSSYAISYSIQKIIESYQGGEKPDVLLAGHYHKADYIFCRGVHAVQTGTTQDQSPFMRKKKLAAHLGGWIIEMATDDNGAITRFKQEFLPFFDNEYYKFWAYKWK